MLAATATDAARHFGPAAAFVTDEGLILSYAQFDTLADEAAVGLVELGVGERAVVGLLLPSVREHFVAADGGIFTFGGASYLGRVVSALL